MSGPPRHPDILAFDRYKVAHPHLTQAHSELLGAVREPGDAVIVLLAGPTGVGKSTLLHHAIRDMRAERAPYASSGGHPVRSFLMPPFGPQGLSMRDVYLTILRSLEEPDVEGKVEYRPTGEDQRLLRGRQRTTEVAARDSVVAALIDRKVEVLVGDEAQHLCGAGGPAHIRSLLESLKWLGMASETLIVLAGTYDLRALIGLNSQLDRRTLPVHFPRYRSEVDSDRDAFINVLRRFEANLPVGGATLVPEWRLLYDACNGCVGSLKVRLRQGLVKATAANRPTEIADVRPTRFERARLAESLTDIERGERDFSQDAPDWSPARRDDGRVRAADTEPVRDARPRKPFKRSPKRDPAGSTGSADRKSAGAS